MRWTTAIFSSREDSGTLYQAICAALQAASSVACVHDVMVNGSEDVAIKTSRHLTQRLRDDPRSEAKVRVWYLPRADKANAWNHYVHSIWSPSDVAFFLDGYVKVSQNAFHDVARALSTDPAMLAATGIPTMGRSANRLRREMADRGGFHGNLYALRHDAMMQLKGYNFHLPRGMYRTDSTIGAAILYNFDPGKFAGDRRRIGVVPAATWSYEAPRLWSPGSWRTYFKRRLRQAQGTLELHAVRQSFDVERNSIGSLPQTVRTLVMTWANDHPDQARHVLRRSPLVAYAYRTLLSRVPDSTDYERCELISETAT